MSTNLTNNVEESTTIIIKNEDNLEDISEELIYKSLKRSSVTSEKSAISDIRVIQTLPESPKMISRLTYVDWIFTNTDEKRVRHDITTRKNEHPMTRYHRWYNIFQYLDVESIWNFIQTSRKIHKNMYDRNRKIYVVNAITPIEYYMHIVPTENLNNVNIIMYAATMTIIERC
jgi:hypothetical protein